MENNQWVEVLLKDRNISLLGFADLSEIDPDTRYGYSYGICISVCPWSKQYRNQFKGEQS